jgi:transposase-like protein
VALPLPGGECHRRYPQLPSLSAKQDSAAAKRFLAKALGGANRPAPRVINTDGHAAYPPAVAQFKGLMLMSCRVWF